MHSDDENVIDVTKRSKCSCIGKNTRLSKLFGKGRHLSAYELNITRLVGAVRTNEFW